MTEKAQTVTRDSTERYELLLDQPPSAKFVYKVLEHGGPLTRSEIIDETLLPGRTATYAISRLRDHSLVELKVNPGNPQKKSYDSLPIEETNHSLVE